MTTLVHLNGPPGIGKSTLAALYIDEHPGTLNLDIDTLHHLIGGWRESEGRFHDLLRPLAHAMAATHLHSGRDVILPQYVGDSDALAVFEQIAVDAGAEFIEIVLLDDKAAAIARFNEGTETGEWARHNRKLVAARGGDDFLARMHDQLLEVVQRRPLAMIVPSEPGAVTATYEAVKSAVEAANDALEAARLDNQPAQTGAPDPP